MKIRLTAILGLKSQGADKAEKETRKLKNNIREAEQSAARMNKNLSSTRTGQSAMEAAGFNRTQYRTDRSVVGGRGATGKNFSGMAAGLGGGGGSLVGAYAQLAANVFAITAAFQALSQAARFEQLTQGLELMGARGGIALKQTADGLKEVTDNAISTADSFKVVAQASSAGLGTDEIQRLGAVARGASLALGRDMSEAMDRLTRGAIKLEPELLDELGIMVRLDEAVKEFAAQNGKAASALTQTERRQAFLNAVLEEGERKFGDIAEQIAANPYDKLSASVRDLATAVGNLVNKALKPAVEIFADNPFSLLIPGVFLLSKALQGLGVGAGLAATSFNGVSDGLRKQIRAIQNTDKEAKALRLGYREDVLDYTRGNLKKSQSLQQFMALQRQSRRELLASTDATGLLTRSTIRLQSAYLSASVAIKTFTKSLVGLAKAIARMLLPMIALTVAFMAFEKVGKIIGNMRDRMKGLTPEIKELNKQLIGLGEAAEKTAEQMTKMSSFEGFDAGIRSLKTFRQKVIELRQEIAAAAEAQTQGIRNAEPGDIVVDVRTARGVAGRDSFVKGSLITSLKRKGIEQDVAEAFSAQIKILRQIDPVQAQITANAMSLAISADEAYQAYEEGSAFIEKIAGSFKDAQTASKALGEAFRDIEGKGLETNLTKSFSAARDLKNELEGLEFGDPNAAIRESEFLTKNVTQLEKINALLGNKYLIAGNINRVQAIQLINDFEQLNIQREEFAILEGKLKIEQEILKARQRTAKLQQQVNADNFNTQKKILGLAGASSSPYIDAVSNINQASFALNQLVETEEQRITLLETTAQKQKNALNDQIRLREAEYGASDLTVRILREQVTAIDERLEAETRAVREERTAAEQKLNNLNSILNAYNDENVAEKRRIDNLKEELGLLKELGSAQSKVASSMASLRQARVQQAAFVERRAVTPQETLDLERRAFQDKIDQIAREDALITKEYDIKFAQLKLQESLARAQFALLKQEADASNLPLITQMETDALSRLGDAFDHLNRMEALATEDLQIRKELLEIERQKLKLSPSQRALAQGQIALSGARQGLANTLGSAGIPSQGREFFLNAIQQGGGIEAFSDKEIEKLRQMSFEMAELNIVTEGTVALFDTMQSSLEEAFMSMIDGSKSAGEAFKDMAKAILAQIAQIIVKLLVVRALNAIGIPAFGEGGIIPMANGGVIPYASGGTIDRAGLSGGIATKPTYLVGEGKYNEAVVPLPNGRSIPVQLSGAGGSQQNNVSVTVNMNDTGATTQTNGQDPARLGQVIAAAVQKELMAQKSPGGLLSKYG